ncbi:flagellar motor switch phosphatase FliY [Halalkalibacter hemicellulosilyticus]|uniref:Flagellar motor switch protein FliN n=1 Tax=Halalkalibacter hemicellulosilyticusJCM 9152 TaxID=1236971 RepID=W4QB21_9BACI|nr:flagellar motor switch phosphatase FliY [Halalkalibacter hemicellulosilyticus]GAE29256.1 flagellar motor switch protein FliN [Halalkalibacter hemicellulosilyticusJCM 9152]
MNDDMLSQDEINELLKGVSSSEDEDSSQSDSDSDLGISDYLSDVEQDALGEIGNISFGSASTALSTLLSQKVDITTPTLSIIRRDELEDEFPRPHVAIHVNYTEGFEGMNLLVMNTSDAAIIADLMLGGDGTNPDEELNEMHTSAVQEAMNQMMGSASTSMSTIFNKRVDISPPGIDLMDVKNNEGTKHVPDDDILVKISFRLTVGSLIDSTIMQLVTISFAKELVNELMNPSIPEEEPVVKQAGEPVQQQATSQGETHSRNQPYPENNSYSNSTSAPQPSYANRGQQHLGGQFNQRDVDVQPAAFSQFENHQLSHEESNNLNMLLDIPLQVTVELGRTKRSIKEILEFSQGSIIELDKLAGEPVDILVNQKLIAKGEVVVIDENFGVRVLDIVSQEARINHLKK